MRKWGFAGFALWALLHTAAAAQQAVPAIPPAARARLRADALARAIGEIRSVTLPENRAMLEAEVAELAWTSDPQLARGLFAGLPGRLQQFVTATQSDPEFAGQIYMLRQQIADIMARTDPELALGFVEQTRGLGGDPGWERQIEFNLAQQFAQRHPARAGELARRHMDRGLSHEQVGVVGRLAITKPDEAAGLATQMVDKLRAKEALKDESQLHVAINLLTAISGEQRGPFMHPEPPKRTDGPLTPIARDLAGIVAAALAQQKISRERYHQLQQALGPLEQFAPELAAPLRRRMDEFMRSDPYFRMQEQFREASNSGNLTALKALVAEAPPELQSQFTRDLAFRAATIGDVDAARDIAETARDPHLRAELLRDVDVIAVQGTAERDVSRALSMASSIQSVAQRVNVLVNIARLVQQRDPEQARNILQQARQGLGARPETANDLNAWHQLVQVAAEMDPETAEELLVVVIERLNELMTGFAAVDGFIGSRSFRNGELLLFNGSPISTLLHGSWSGLSTLARRNPEGAFSAASKFDNPGARAMAYLRIAREMNPVQP